MYRNHQNLEKAALCGLLSAIAAVGIFFGTLFFFHIDLFACDPLASAAVFAVLSGGIWLCLLVRNC